MSENSRTKIEEYLHEKDPATFGFLDAFLAELTGMEVTEKLRELQFADTDIMLSFDENKELNDIYFSAKYYNIFIDISILRDRTYICQFYADPDTNRTYNETERKAEGSFDAEYSLCDCIVSMRKFLETCPFIDKNFEEHRIKHPKKYVRFNPAAVGPLLIILACVLPPAAYFSAGTTQQDMWIYGSIAIASLVAGIILCITTRRKSKNKHRKRR